MEDESTQATQATQEVEAAEPHGEDAPDYKALYEQALAQSRKWEGRAKANKEKADRWDAYEQEGMSEAEKLAQRAESAEAELAQLKASAQHDADAKEVSKETGVPVHLLAFCADRAAMEEFAKQYATDNKPPAAAPAPESRVIRGGKQATTTRDKFASYFE